MLQRNANLCISQRSVKAHHLNKLGSTNSNLYDMNFTIYGLAVGSLKSYDQGYQNKLSFLHPIDSTIFVFNQFSSFGDMFEEWTDHRRLTDPKATLQESRLTLCQGAQDFHLQPYTRIWSLGPELMEWKQNLQGTHDPNMNAANLNKKKNDYKFLKCLGDSSESFQDYFPHVEEPRGKNKRSRWETSGHP